MAFSPDGRWLASGSGDQTIRLWQVATGRELRTLTGHTGPVAAVEAVAFSPDGRWLASGSFNTTITLWEVATGARVGTSADPTGIVLSVAFSPDGRWLASGSNDKTIKLWEVATGRELRTLTGHTAEVEAVALSPDGRLLASGSGDNAVKLWDVATGKEVSNLGGDIGMVRSVAFSPDGRWLASGSWDKTIKLWDMGTGRQARTLSGHTERVQSVAFSPDGRWLASGSEDKTVKLWEAGTWRDAATLPVPVAYTSNVAFSPDGRWLATGVGEGIKVWDVATRQAARTLDDSGDLVTAVAFSPTEDWLAVGGKYDTIMLWEPSTGRNLGYIGALKCLVGVLCMVRSLAFSPDGNWLASTSLEGTVKLQEPATGVDFSFRHSGVLDIAFSPDSRWLVSTSGENSTKLWEAKTGREVRTLTGGGTSVTFSPNGRWLALGAEDGSTRIWDPNTGEQLAALLSTAHGSDWLVFTPDGLFDGSPAAWNLLLWRFNNNTFDVAPVEVFFREFYHPGLLAEILAGKRPKATTDIANIDRRQPRVKLAAGSGQPAAQGPIASRKVSLTLEVSEAPADATHQGGSGARDVRLFRNGSLVRVWRGDLALTGGKATLTAADVTLVGGENRFSAYAFSKSNIKSTDATLPLTGADSLKRPGTAYILAIGINRYEDERFQLNFAVADAQDYAQTLQADQQKLARYSEVKVITLADAEATKSNILGALARLAGTGTGPPRSGEPQQFADLKPAQPEDAVFIYYAGHGAAPGKSSKRFYLIAQEFKPPDESASALPETLPGTVNDLELGAAMEKIDAGELTLVIDACQSGKTLESDDPRQGPMNSGGLAQLAYEKGMYILAAAQGDQAAKELSQLGHGLLTYALVEEGLKQSKADDEPKDGQIVLREWLDYSTERLPQLQLEGMQRMASLGRDVPIVNGEDKIKELERRSLQRPRVFYRREPEAQPLVIAKP